MSFPGEYRVEWMSPEETYMHLENTGSKIYRGLVETVGMKKSAGLVNCHFSLPFCLSVLISNEDSCRLLSSISFKSHVTCDQGNSKVKQMILVSAGKIMFGCEADSTTNEIEIPPKGSNLGKL